MLFFIVFSSYFLFLRINAPAKAINPNNEVAASPLQPFFLPPSCLEVSSAGWLGCSETGSTDGATLGSTEGSTLGSTEGSTLGSSLYGSGRAGITNADSCTSTYSSFSLTNNLSQPSHV